MTPGESWEISIGMEQQKKRRKKWNKTDGERRRYYLSDEIKKVDLIDLYKSMAEKLGFSVENWAFNWLAKLPVELFSFSPVISGNQSSVREISPLVFASFYEFGLDLEPNCFLWLRKPGEKSLNKRLLRNKTGRHDTTGPWTFARFF